MNLFDIFNIMFFLFFARLVEKYVFKNFISRYREEKELRFHISLPCIVKGLVTLSDNVSIGMQASINAVGRCEFAVGSNVRAIF